MLLVRPSLTVKTIILCFNIPHFAFYRVKNIYQVGYSLSAPTVLPTYAPTVAPTAAFTIAPSRRPSVSPTGYLHRKQLFDPIVFRNINTPITQNTVVSTLTPTTLIPTTTPSISFSVQQVLYATYTVYAAFRILIYGVILADDQQRRLQLQVAGSAARHRVEYRGEFEHLVESDSDSEHHSCPRHLHRGPDSDSASDGFECESAAHLPRYHSERSAACRGVCSRAVDRGDLGEVHEIHARSGSQVARLRGSAERHQLYRHRW